MGDTKEPFYKSTRFWTMVASVIVMAIATFVDLEKYGVTQEELVALLVSMAGVVMTFIWGRTARNTDR